MEEIFYEQRKKSLKLIEFEERKGIILSFYFPVVTRYWRYGIVTSKYLIIPIIYMIGIVPAVSALCLAMDILLNILRVSPKVLSFLFINLLDLVKWIIKASWEVCGDMIKVVLQKTLSVIGFFIAIIILYMLFKSDAFQIISDYFLEFLRDPIDRL